MPEPVASPPAIPAATDRQQRKLDDLEARHREGESVERRRQLRGLLILVFLVIAFGIARAGADRVFTHGWWRVW